MSCFNSKMMFLGLFPDGGTDGSQQLFVRRATAQQGFQVTSGLTGKAGAPENPDWVSRTRLQEAQNLPWTAAMKPMSPFQPGTV